MIRDTDIIANLPNTKKVRIAIVQNNIPEYKANARLIAAAPKLLEELKLIAQGWQIRRLRLKGTEPLTPWEEERYKFIQAAIREAEGE